MGLEEALEDVRALCLGDALATIANGDLNLPGRCLGEPDLDRCIRRTVLDRVVEQVRHDLIDAQRIDR